MSETQDKIFQEIRRERNRQDAKFDADRTQPVGTWCMILGEEVGEVNQAALDVHFDDKNHHEYRLELIQVAAVAVAAIEDLDRQMGERS